MKIFDRFVKINHLYELYFYKSTFTEDVDFRTSMYAECSMHRAVYVQYTYSEAGQKIMIDMVKEAFENVKVTDDI